MVKSYINYIPKIMININKHWIILGLSILFSKYGNCQVVITDNIFIFYQDTIIGDNFDYSLYKYQDYKVLQEEKKRCFSEAKNQKRIDYPFLGIYFITFKNVALKKSYYTFGFRLNPIKNHYKGNYFQGTISLLGEKVNSKTLFKDLYESKNLIPWIDKSIYSDEKNASSIIVINLSKISLILLFDYNSGSIQDLKFYFR
jgi:hypothetical protein